MTMTWGQRLVRGAGVKGLAGMPETRSLAAGRLWRPLLAEPRRALLAYAEAEGLDWIEDPSNADIRLDRNYLRHQVLPRLTTLTVAYCGIVSSTLP